MEQKFCPNCAQPLAPDAKFCEYCGFSTVQNWDECPHALPYGTVLGGRYITGRVLGRGGFGITYIAKDFQTGQRVAIKEYFPDTVASRGQGNSIVPYTGQANDDFNYGKAAFLEEAKTLAQFVNEPGIVHIHSYFEEFGTAYFSMELVDGVSLQTYIEQSGGKIRWDEAKRILLPVMDALGKVHSKGIIHRDIKPDNIYLTKDGAVKILDFGSARYSMGEKSRSLDVVLTHGFAPKEQYSRHGRQGPYTDVYALAATFYYAVTGRKPQDSIDRMDNDSLAMPNSLGARIPPGEEEVLLKALSVDPQDRFPSMAAFRQALDQGCIPAAPQGYANYQQPAQPVYQQPVQQPYRQPAQQTYQQPVQQTYQQPAQQTYQQPAQQPYQQPAQQTYQQPAQQPYRQPAQQAYQQPAQQTYQQPAQQAYQQPAQQTYQQPAQQVYRQPSRPAKKNGWLLPVILGGVALIGLVIGLVLLLGGKKNEPQLDATTEPPAVTQEPTVEPTQSTEPAPTMQTLPTQAPQDNDAELAGYYTIQSISMNGVTYDIDAIRENLADPETFYLIMREDGTGTMGLDGEENDLTWNDRGTMVMEDTTIDFTAEDGTIHLSVPLDDGIMHMVFARAGSAPQAGQSSDGLSGTCGVSATWVFDPDSGTLTISGEGAIYDYSDAGDIPWYSHHDDIKSLEIEEGITRIGKCAFYECAEWYVSLPKSVTSIGELAFAFSQKLYTANIPSSVKSIEDGAFYQCTNCENVYMHCTQLELGQNVFASCENLRFLLFYGDVSSIGSNAFYDDENMVVYTPDTSAWSNLAKKNYGGAPIWMVGGADGTIYKADKFDVFLPKDWDDNCTVEIDGDVINVYHTASKNAGYGGFLFGLSIYEKESDYDYFPSYQKIGTLKKSGTTYDLVAIFPTDVQTDGSHQSSYMKYFNEIDAILLTIYGRNSFSLWFD